MSLSAQSLDSLRALVDGTTVDPELGLAGVTVVVVDRDGKELFAHSSGKRGLASKEPMTLEDIFWIASCTKMLTGVSCMQLVERGILSLDDGEQLENFCPELKTLQVLRPDGTLEEKKRKITLRMLLTHTAGFGYTFFNERLRDWSLPGGFDEFSGRIEDMVMPLLFQPGEGWEYGVNIDWAGIALERVTGLKLNDYMQKNIFQPLGLTEMSMIPNKEMRSKLAYMHQREKDGKLRPRDHLQRVPIVVDLADEKKVGEIFNSGGAGMYARPQEYCKVLAVLLNDGTCPRTNHQLLKKETVQEMFTNQIANFPNFGRQGIPPSKPDLTNPIPDLYPVAASQPQGWGLTFMLPNSTATGRSQPTGQWAGLANLFWWCDREKGVAGMIASQVLPFADAQVLGLWGQIEMEVYKGLAA